MTLVVAGTSNDARVLAADRRLHIQLSSGEIRRADHDGDKLFAVAGCAVASINRAPPNWPIGRLLDVHEERLSAEELAHLLKDRVVNESDRGDCTLVIAEPNQASFWEVSTARATAVP